MTVLRGLALFFLLGSFVPLAHAHTSCAKPTGVTYTTIDFPGAYVTSVNGINSAGDMVGDYIMAPGGANHAFVLRGGQFTSFDYPGAGSTIAYNINDVGQIVGSANGVDGVSVLAFVYDGLTFTPIIFRGAGYTEGYGINNAGDVVGRLRYGHRAFEYSNGHFIKIEPPGESTYKGALGINNLGVIVGYWIHHGFRSFIDVDGDFTLFQLGAGTVANGVNDDEVVVGWYERQTSQLGFAYKHGKCLALQYPGASITSAEGINNSGQVVGRYGSDFTDHGFVTSPIKSADFH